MSLAAERKCDYIDKVFMQAWTLRKLETFYTFFKVAVVLPRLSNIICVSKNQFKSF